ncbi:MAG TPA: HAD family phosphatase [Tepidisphaeraceae bacterium]|jgi:sugar-phosphatase
MFWAKAVLFDMDGVVIDTRQSVIDFWEAVAAEHRVTLTDDDFDRHIHGVPAAATLRSLFPGLSSEQTAAVMDRSAQYERGLQYTEVAGVTRFLKQLTDAGVKAGLVTSGTRWKVEDVLQQLQLDGRFDVIVTAGDIERGKPDPACYLAAAGKLGAHGAECVVFEDSLAGVRAAKAAGAACVGVQTGGRVKLIKAEGVQGVIPDFTSIEGSVEPSAVRVRIGDEFVFDVARGLNRFQKEPDET